MSSSSIPDAIGRPVQVGDTVGGTTSGRYPATIVGPVVKVGKGQVKVLVGQSGQAFMVPVGDEKWISSDRIFLLEGPGVTAAPAPRPGALRGRVTPEPEEQHPDRPYTDADLRAEAIAQHRDLTDDPEYSSVGEAMCDAKVSSSATGETWETLLDEDGYSAAQEQIHGLVSRAADISGWAVRLGADGLTAHPEMFQADRPEDNTPAVRIHLAFAADMPQHERAGWSTDIYNQLRSLMPRGRR